MSRWPQPPQLAARQAGTIGVNSLDTCGVAGLNVLGRTAGASTAWPAANRALYIPFYVTNICTVTQFWWFNGATVNAGVNDMDVGIYDEFGNRLVSQGGTISQTGTSVVQVSDITDTTIKPGAYFMAMCVSQTTSTFNRIASLAGMLEGCGMQQQAVGAVALPNPATFANPAATYCPRMGICFSATI